MSGEDLARMFGAQEEVRRWTAERENASAQLQLARAREARARLLSQHEPVASLGVDRAVLRVLLNYTSHHDTGRLGRELAELPGAPP